MLRDVRHTIRLLRRSPGYAAVVLLTLATAIGLTTALFSSVSLPLLKTPPATLDEWPCWMVTPEMTTVPVI